MVKEKISQIRYLLQKNEIERSIALLTALLDNDKKLDEVILQSARKYRIEQEIRTGVVSYQNSDLTNNQIAKALLDICRELEETWSNRNSKGDGFAMTEHSHVLHQYPRGPMIEAHLVRSSIIEAYAKSIRLENAHQVISEANAFRLEADPNDPKVTLIEIYVLPPVEKVAPLEFWTSVFTEARLHGPRMLAALLLIVPDGNFPPLAKEAKHKLLEKLRT